MYASETELATALRRQDRKAQERLYEQYRVPLYRMCLRYAQDEQQAEDFLHDGMIKVFSDTHQYSGKGALGGWVRRVVLNVALQHLRRRPRVVSEEQAPELWAAPNPELDEELNKLNVSQIRGLIKGLPEGYRTVFNLYYLEDMGHKDIAVSLNISEGASKSQLYKARLALRKSIKKQYPTYQYRTN